RLIEACSGTFRKILRKSPAPMGLTPPRKLCNCSGNVFGNRKEPSMRFRPSRWLAAAVAAGCAVPAMLVAGAAPAAVYEGSSAGSVTAAHRCLVMTGSGDPAFTRNFNPYTATGLPSGSFVQGAFYEPLVVTPEGGLRAVPWLARSWKWTRGNRTLTLNLAHGVRWSDGKLLTSTDVVY